MPPFIALCGWPKAGKTTIQRLLQKRWGYLPQDDGRVLREAAKILYGLTDWHVSTQEGKASKIVVCGRETTVRFALGNLGDLLEAQWGTQFIPEATLRDCLAPWGGDVSKAPRMSFGSVRKDQGITYRRHGGIVVAVRRPGIPEPENAFDRFDPAYVDVWIDNPVPLGAPETPENLARFEQAALDVLSKHLG
jgi:hypothetical protein